MKVITWICLLFVVRKASWTCGTSRPIPRMTHKDTSTIEISFFPNTKFSPRRLKDDKNDKKEPEPITFFPTVSPVRAPSSMPTNIPTSMSTSSPKSLPSTTPTFHPTVSHTNTPTTAPTKRPSSEPEDVAWIFLDLMLTKLVVNVKRDSDIQYDTLQFLTETHLEKYMSDHDDIKEYLVQINMQLLHSHPSASQNQRLLQASQEVEVLFEGVAVFTKNGAPSKSRLHELQEGAFIKSPWKDAYKSSLRTNNVFTGLVGDAVISLEALNSNKTSPGKSIDIGLIAGATLGALSFFAAILGGAYIYKRKTTCTNPWVKDDSSSFSIADEVQNDSFSKYNHEQNEEDGSMAALPFKIHVLDTSDLTKVSSATEDPKSRSLSLDENQEVLISPTGNHQIRAISPSSKKTVVPVKPTVGDDEYSLSGDIALEGGQSAGETVLQKVMASLHMPTIFDTEETKELDDLSVFSYGNASAFSNGNASAFSYGNLHNQSVFENPENMPTILESNKLPVVGSNGVEVALDDESEDDVMHGVHDIHDDNLKFIDNCGMQLNTQNIQKEKATPFHELLDTTDDDFHYLSNSESTFNRETKERGLDDKRKKQGKTMNIFKPQARNHRGVEKRNRFLNDEELEKPKRVANFESREERPISPRNRVTSSSQFSRETKERGLDDKRTGQGKAMNIFKPQARNHRSVEENNRFLNDEELDPANAESRKQGLISPRNRVTVITQKHPVQSSPSTPHSTPRKFSKYKYRDVDDSSEDDSGSSYISSDGSYDDGENSLMRDYKFTVKNEDILVRASRFEKTIERDKKGMLSADRNRRSARIDGPSSMTYNKRKTMTHRKVKSGDSRTTTNDAANARRNRLANKGRKEEKRTENVNPIQTRNLRKARLSGMSSS